MRQNIKLKSGKAVVCAGLDEISKIMSVPPDVWDSTCRRQGSWYRNSEKNGKYLIISSFELEGYERFKEAVITQSNFILPRPITREEKKIMVDDEQFKSLVPREWYSITDLEQRIWIRWARKLGSEEGWGFLFFLTHTACHANFYQTTIFLSSQMAKKFPIRLTEVQTLLFLLF